MLGCGQRCDRLWGGTLWPTQSFSCLIIAFAFAFPLSFLLALGTSFACGVLRLQLVRNSFLFVTLILVVAAFPTEPAGHRTPEMIVHFLVLPDLGEVILVLLPFDHDTGFRASAVFSMLRLTFDIISSTIEEGRVFKQLELGVWLVGVPLWVALVSQHEDPTKML